MKLYLAIKYHANQRNRPVIERIAEVLTAQGHDLFCIARDLEQWGALSFPADKLMQYTFQNCRAMDTLAAIGDADYTRFGPSDAHRS